MYFTLSFCWYILQVFGVLDKTFNKVLHTSELPREIRTLIPPHIFRTSREYALATLEFLLAKSVVGVAFSSIIIHGDYMARIWTYAQTKNPYGNEIMTSCIWLCLLCTLTALIDLPFDLYLAFILERSLDLKIVTPYEFFIDHSVGFLLIQFLSMGIAASIVLLIQFIGRYFFISLWYFCCVALAAIATLAPLIIFPSSNDVVEFPESHLRRNIENLCKEIAFPLDRVEMLLQNTQMDEHSCVYYYGLSSKCVVISVNIVPIPGITNILKEDEIMALLAHQLGHWYNRHITKKFLVMQAVLFMWFFIFTYLLERKILYEAFGFQNSQPVLVGIMISIQYVMMPYNVLIAAALISLSRTFEYEADIFAAQLGMGNALKRALKGIYVVSFQFPVLDDLYSKYSFYQPSLLERMRRLSS